MPPSLLRLNSTIATCFPSFSHQPSSPLSSFMKGWTVWPSPWEDKFHQPGSSLCLSRQGLLFLLLFPALAWSNTSPPNQGWLSSHNLLYAQQNNDSRQGKEEMFTLLQKKKKEEKKKMVVLRHQASAFPMTALRLSTGAKVLLAGQVMLKEWNHSYFCQEERPSCLSNREEIGRPLYQISEICRIGRIWGFSRKYF